MTVVTITATEWLLGIFQALNAVITFKGSKTLPPLPWKNLREYILLQIGETVTLLLDYH